MTARYISSLAAALLVVLLVLVYQYFSISSDAEWVTNFDSRPDGSETLYEEIQVEAHLQPLPTVKSYDKRWVQLGKALFNSPLLSIDNSVSCASCHDVFNGGDDGFPVSTGVKQQLGERNSPSVLNAVFNFRQFWDGRSTNLRDQAIGPIHNPSEMGIDWEKLVKKLKAESSFNRVFTELSPEGVTPENILKAIVLFEESLVTEDAPIDLYLKGDMSALSDRQIVGYQNFIEFGCVTCHQGKNIGGNLYQKIGRLDRVPEFLLDDLGRYEITKNEVDRHVFKVPSLRNVAMTSPYFHNGSVDSLSDAIRIMARGQLGLELSDREVEDIRLFLQSLTGNLPRSLTE